MSSIALKILAAALGAPGMTLTANTPANFVSAQILYTSTARLSDTSAIIVYSDNTNAALKAVVATVSGATVSFGTVATVTSGGSPREVEVCALTSTSGIFVYENRASNYAAARGFTISGTTITVGSEVTTGALGQQLDVAPLTSTTAICTVYANSTASAAVLSLSGTTVTWGTLATLSTGRVNSSFAVAAFSSTAAIAIWSNLDNSNRPTVNVMSISGTTVTPGTEAVIETDGISATNWAASVVALSATSGILMWMHATNNYPRVVGFTISGQTPTFGTPADLGTSSLSPNHSKRRLIALDSTKAVLLYSATNMLARVLTLSGAEATSGDAQTINEYASCGSLCALTSNLLMTGFATGTTAGTAETISAA